MFEIEIVLGNLHDGEKKKRLSKPRSHLNILSKANT